MADKKTLGQFLKEEREKRGLTQEQMAEQLGTSRTYYCSLEKGYFVAGYDFQNRIASCFNRSPAYIRKLIKNSLLAGVPKNFLNAKSV